MKKVQLLINIILALAVLALFVLHFTGIGSRGVSESASGASASTGDGKIVYVQIDSVLAKYDMATDLSAELEKSVESSDAEYSSKQSAYQKQVTDYQDKYNRGLLTRSEATTIEQELYTKQQELLQLQEELTNNLTEQQTVMNRKLIDAIMKYLNENSRQFNYTYVLGTSFGGNILYAHDSLDITESVIEGLNSAYQQQLRSSR